MNKKLLASTMAVAFTAIGATSTASAALATDATLGMDSFVLGGYYGNIVVGGSYFAMDNDGSGSFEKAERVGLTPGADGGITLGSAQGFADIDNTWVFFSATGSHTQAATLSVATDDGAGNATIDMSGWNVNWNGGDIDMGQGANAVVTCGNTCEVGDTYTLDYTAVVPSGGFTGVNYQLRLEGTIAAASAVPVPAAVWLFGSGLVGLAGVARRRKAA